MLTNVLARGENRLANQKMSDQRSMTLTVSSHSCHFAENNAEVPTST
jgi:hypothetical protein